MPSQTILIIIGIVIVVLLLTRKGREKVVGICSVALGVDAKKQENKEKIVALLASRGSASNSDIREALQVSDRSVVRYMDELEREGKAEQVGTTGRNVVYRLKN